MLSTHVLDLVLGRPAEGVAVEVAVRDGAADPWAVIGRATTDDDGRVAELLGDDAQLRVADYRLRFATGPYFAARDLPTFYPEVVVVFSVTEPRDHHHVPLLLSPYGYSTYRGS